MPFKSEKQKKFMFARHPEIARKWAAEGKGDVKKMSPDPSALHVPGTGMRLRPKKKLRLRAKNDGTTMT